MDAIGADVLSLARIALAARELGDPERTARLRRRDGSASPLAVVAAGRQLAQGVLLLGTRRGARRLGALVDALHATSMIAAAALGQRGAMAEAAMAAAFGCAEWGGAAGRRLRRSERRDA